MFHSFLVIAFSMDLSLGSQILAKIKSWLRCEPLFRTITRPECLCHLKEGIVSTPFLVCYESGIRADSAGCIVQEVEYFSFPDIFQNRSSRHVR